MATYDELPVYKATYDLLLEMFRFMKNFSKEYKYTVGESLKKETIELITLIYRANSSGDLNLSTIQLSTFQLINLSTPTAQLFLKSPA